MRLRHSPDARSLVWSLAFFPLIPTIGYMRPALAPCLLPVSLYLAYIAGVQHVGCDHGSPNDRSRNFVSPLQNWLVFDAGFRTVHHEHPGVHWSEYRKLHAVRSPAIRPDLNQHSIAGFCVRRYVLAPLGVTRPAWRGGPELPAA